MACRHIKDPSDRLDRFLVVTANDGDFDGSLLQLINDSDSIRAKEILKTKDGNKISID